jgi:hypothetical protein
LSVGKPVEESLELLPTTPLGSGGPYLVQEYIYKRAYDSIYVYRPVIIP